MLGVWKVDQGVSQQNLLLSLISLIASMAQGQIEVYVYGEDQCSLRVGEMAFRGHRLF